MGSRGMDDLEISGSGNGDDDEDTMVKIPPPPKTTPRSPVVGREPIDVAEPGKGDSNAVDSDINFQPGEGGTKSIFDNKEETPASFFSQPGILAGKNPVEN